MTNTIQQPQEALSQVTINQMPVTRLIQEPQDVTKQVPADQLAKIPMAKGEIQEAKGSGIQVPDSAQAGEIVSDLKKIAVKTISVYTGNIGYGSGPNNCNYAGKIYLSSNGMCRFTGHYQNTGNIPIFPAPTQQFMVGMAIVANNKKGFSFTCQGYANSAPQAMSEFTWDHTTYNQEVKNNFQELLDGWRCSWNSNNQVTLGDWWNVLQEVWNDIETIVGVVEEAITVATVVVSVLG